MASNLLTYTNYFRNLAVTHPDLQHNPASETGDAPVGEKRFCKWTADEVVGGLRTKISFPALLLQLYEIDTAAATTYDIRRRPKGAFAVVQKAKNNDIAAEEEAYQLTEKICNEILQQIWADHYLPNVDICDRPFNNFDFNRINMVPTGKLFESHYGWNVDFEFEFQQDINLGQPPPAGYFDEIIVLGYKDTYLGLRNN